ncbi:MAG: hypothetical protein EHM72_17835 [Calditrichaeota bacterium]|nr:MAG: hypothetical protein EHM72_17835 [Calditrichota bacterium]
MNTIKAIFFDTTGVLFVAVFVFLLILFFLDFKFTSRQSWVALIAFAVLGGFFALQSWRRKQLLRMLESREKELLELEKKYDKLKSEAKITEEMYRRAKAELEAAKLETAKSIAKADGELYEELTKIENEYENMTVDESVGKIKELLGRK